MVQLFSLFFLNLFLLSIRIFAYKIELICSSEFIILMQDADGDAFECFFEINSQKIFLGYFLFQEFGFFIGKVVIVNKNRFFI